jgi:hypothetical protein
MPLITYATASPTVISTPSSFCAPALPPGGAAGGQPGRRHPTALGRLGASSARQAWRGQPAPAEQQGRGACRVAGPAPGACGLVRGSGRAGRGAGAHRSSRSDLTLLSTSMIFEPASSCTTSPDVTIGLIPSSMHVPLRRRRRDSARPCADAATAPASAPASAEIAAAGAAGAAAGRLQAGLIAGAQA